MNSSVRTVAWRGILAAQSLALVLLLGLAASARAQETDTIPLNPAAPPETERAKAPPIQIGHYRPHDARGLNVFETPKEEGVPFRGFVIQWGAAFTQQFQALDHENNATPNITGTPPVDVNSLIDIGSGFNNADANLYMDAQLGRGIRVALTSYLSSRHHPESWVKDGYLLIDASPWEQEMLDNIMRYLSLRLGQFEIN
jgi:hypothetical protein